MEGRQVNLIVEAAVTGALDYTKLNRDWPDDGLREKLVLDFLERRRLGEVAMAGLAIPQPAEGRAIMTKMLMTSMLPWFEAAIESQMPKGYENMSMEEVKEAFKAATGLTDEQIARANKAKNKA